MKYRILSPDTTIWPPRYPWELREGVKHVYRNRRKQSTRSFLRRIAQFVGRCFKVGDTVYELRDDGSWRKRAVELRDGSMQLISKKEHKRQRRG